MTNLINDIFQEVDACKDCSLSNNRLAKISYRGTIGAPIFMIGEAPGETEQRLGFPFIGRSGRLLDRLMLNVGITEKDVYITNIVKHRPPDNRKPFFDEIKACEKFIKKEIEVLKPKLIVTLGKTSGYWFNEDKPYDINKLYLEKKWLPLYHPSYLLKTPKEIDYFIEAFRKAVKEMVYK